jgi:DNA polymerase elongation subunit (family B)
MISTVNSDGKENQFIVGEDKTDASVLEQFSSYVQLMTDVIVSYGANGKDWNYLKSRCKKQGLKLELGRAGVNPTLACMGMFRYLVFQMLIWRISATFSLR